MILLEEKVLVFVVEIQQEEKVFVVVVETVEVTIL